MSERAFFQTTYLPDYAEMFAVSMASRRYQYTAGQRHVWWVPTLLFLAAIMALLFWGDELISSALEPATGTLVASWAPLALVIGLWAVFIWLVCYKLNFILSARWIAQRKPPQSMKFSADDDVLRWDSEEAGNWLSWSAVERLFVTPDAICFLHGGMTLYVPRRLFSSPAALTAFLDRALSRLSDHARSISETDPGVLAARKA